MKRRAYAALRRAIERPRKWAAAIERDDPLTAARALTFQASCG